MYWFKKKKISDNGKWIDLDCEDAAPYWSVESNNFISVYLSIYLLPVGAKN